MLNKNKIKILFICIFLILVFFIVLKIDKRISNKNNSQNIVENKEVNVYANSNLDELIEAFEKKYKNSLVFTRRGDYDSSFKNSRESLEIWDYIYNKYKNQLPQKYNNSKDWSKQIEIIYEISIKSNNFIIEKKLSNANKELNKIRIILRKIRRENNINNINDQMLDFYDSFQAVISAGNKTETLDHMVNMKINFVHIKELNLNSEYNNKITKIEKTISEIDSLVTADFREAQKRLLPEFENLYISLN